MDLGACAITYTESGSGAAGCSVGCETMIGPASAVVVGIVEVLIVHRLVEPSVAICGKVALGVVRRVIDVRGIRSFVVMAGLSTRR